jgi:rRNA-processing protein FCF1
MPGVGCGDNMNIAIDSNALTYLINAIDPDYDPLNDTPKNKKERQAMLRIFLYQGDPFHILPQVIKEYNDIPGYEWRSLHESTTWALFMEFHIANQKHKIDQRRDEFLTIHKNKHKDCQLLAEAESASMDVLLTRDNNFKKNLSEIAKIKIMYPSEYWESLNMQAGISPKIAPATSNPLFGKYWWQI